MPSETLFTPLLHSKKRKREKMANYLYKNIWQVIFEFSEYSDRITIKLLSKWFNERFSVCRDIEYWVRWSIKMGKQAAVLGNLDISRWIYKLGHYHIFSRWGSGVKRKLGSGFLAGKGGHPDVIENVENKKDLEAGLFAGGHVEMIKKINMNPEHYRQYITLVFASKIPLEKKTGYL